MDTLTPITHDFIESCVKPNKNANARDIIHGIKDTDDLTRHSLIRTRSLSEARLIRCIIKQHQPGQDPQEYLDLDWQCIRRWIYEANLQPVRQAYEDGRYITAFTNYLQSLLDRDVHRTAIENHWDHVLTHHIPQLALEPHLVSDQKQNWSIWKEMWTRSVFQSSEKTIFQSYLEEAYAKQHSMPPRSCLINLDVFMPNNAARKRIQKLWTDAERTFKVDCRGLYHELFVGALRRAMPLVCPELSTRIIEDELVPCYESVWDHVGSKDPIIRVWLYSFISHLVQLKDCKAHAPYLISVIYQMRKVSAACFNRVVYEWHQVIMLYWNHIFESEEQRMDWIAIKWKQDFLDRQIQLLIQKAPDHEIEYYRGNQVYYDELLHFGMLSEYIDYTVHFVSGTLIPSETLFGLFFDELHSLTTDPNEWVEHTLRVCSATRLRHGLYYTNDVLKSRLQAWLSGDGPNGDLKHLPYTGAIDDIAVRHQLGRCLGRQVQGAEFETLRPHVCSLRYFLRLYMDDPTYADKEVEMLSCLMEILGLYQRPEMQSNNAEVETLSCLMEILGLYQRPEMQSNNADQQTQQAAVEADPYTRITNLALGLHSSYEEAQKVIARPIVLQEGLDQKVLLLAAG